MKSISELCQAQKADRNLSWEKELLTSFLKGPLFLKQEEPFLGPDGFSYMAVSSESGTQLNLEDFLDWCYSSGVGLVLNWEQGKTPDYVFNYGMLWNQVVRGRFLNEEEAQEAKEVSQVLVHEISEGYLPKVVRENLSEFLRANAVTDTKISLVSKGANTAYELLWFFPNQQDLEEKDQKSLLEALSWFLPLNYKVTWATEAKKDFLFQDLV